MHCVQRELLGVIGRCTIQGLYLRIPAFLHQVELVFEEWGQDGLVDMERLARPALLNPTYPCDHAAGDPSAIVDEYVDSWWLTGPHCIRGGKTWTLDLQTHLKYFSQQVRLLQLLKVEFQQVVQVDQGQVTTTVRSCYVHDTPQMNIYLEVEGVMGRCVLQCSEIYQRYLARQADLCAKLRLQKSFHDPQGYIPPCTELKHHSCHGEPSDIDLGYPRILL